MFAVPRATVCCKIVTVISALIITIIIIWQKDLSVFRGSQRDELSLPEMFSAGAAFQRSFTAQQFASL